MILQGYDPGGTTGWATVLLNDEHKLIPVNFDHDKDTSMQNQIERIREADLVIIENWRTDPKYAKSGAFDQDEMIAPQVIGSLKTLCKIWDIPFVLQPSSIKPVGYGYLGKPYVKGKKGMHKWDALAHVVYYAVRHLAAMPPGTV